MMFSMGEKLFTKWKIVYLLSLFDGIFRILGSIKMKFGQILVQIVKIIFNLCLAVLWRLETISRPFYDFAVK